MNVKLVRQDIEGDLIEVASAGPAHFAKRLSTAIAWHVYDPADVTNVADSLVEDVSHDASAGVHELHYRPGVELFDFASLRHALLLDSPLGPWMAALLASELCSSLKALHDEDIPQFMLHPERVCRVEGRFAVLPTLPGILPPYSQLRSNEVAGWLHFVSPEALRTRGIDKEMLFSADLFSLGRMLLLLCAPSWHPQGSNPRELALQCVERGESAVHPAVPPAFEMLATIWRRAASLLPADRPGLAELQQQLESARDELAPEKAFEALLRDKRLTEAEDFLAFVEKACTSQALPLAERSRHLMAADLCMARSPPEAGRAIMHLELAESKHYEAAIDLRLARAYRHFTANPNHLRLSSDSYQIAANLLLWPADVVDEWTSVLRRIDDVDYVLECLNSIAIRTKDADLLLIDMLIRQRKFVDAWHEVVQLFRSAAWDEALFQRASEIASHLDESMLIFWLYQFQDEPGCAAPAAIACSRLGEKERAESYLAEAREFVPQTGS